MVFYHGEGVKKPAVIISHRTRQGGIFVSTVGKAENSHRQRINPLATPTKSAKTDCQPAYEN
jgi:hypothetical protein